MFQSSLLKFGVIYSKLHKKNHDTIVTVTLLEEMVSQKYAGDLDNPELIALFSKIFILSHLRKLGSLGL